MKLNACNGKGRMEKRHGQPRTVAGVHVQVVGKVFVIDHPAVVMSDLHLLFQTVPHRAQRPCPFGHGVEAHPGTAPVQRFGQIAQGSPKWRAKACIPRHTPSKGMRRDTAPATTSISCGCSSGSPGPGERTNASVRVQHSSVQSPSDHRDLGPQTLQIVGEVPSEGIVVVEQGDAHEV